MADVTVKVDGLAEIDRKLRLLPRRIGINAMRRALRKGAIVIRDQARANAKQVDDPNTRENIAKNIVVQSGGRRRERAAGGVMMRVGIMGGAAANKRSQDASGNPGGDTRHWRFIEFGTSTVQARPFMRQAMASAAEKAMNTAASAMDTEINKELAKLG